jgi:hypothetical protein
LPERQNFLQINNVLPYQAAAAQVLFPQATLTLAYGYENLAFQAGLLICQPLIGINIRLIQSDTLIKTLHILRLWKVYTFWNLQPKTATTREK